MKRTQNKWNETQKPETYLKGQSGMINFRGEDLEKESREIFLKNKQREFLLEQIKEKENRKLQEKEQDRLYHLQTMKINEIRGALENQFVMKKKIKEDTIKKLNWNDSINFADEKKKERQRELVRQREELEEINRRGLKKDFLGHL